jgi:MHS family proline/betaine transporter-like MFS transporter|tara:strand:+ start:131 stop:1384 length:1254 start_codon:yes stop_codon:yes gene_type:complete
LNNKTKVIAAGLIGNILEWYDFAVYGFFAVIIGKQFFPSDDPTISLIAAFGAFAAGFLMRPIGAALFGRIGDLYGRKRMLFLSVMLMAIPTFIIGILPNHSQIGYWAAILMVVMRMLQGLSVGGEYTGSFVYLIEQAPQNKRAFYGSFSGVGATLGILLGSGIGAYITSVLTESQLENWGWRIPFLLGISIGILGFIIRRGLPENPISDTPKKSKTPLKELFQSQRKQIFQGFGLNIMSAVCFYLIFVYMTTWLVNQVHETESVALDINSISLVIILICAPLFALLSDKIGRKPMLIIGSLLMVIFAYPLVGLMDHDNFTYILIGQCLFALILSIYISAIPAFLAELFPSKIRASATSISYNIPYAIFGGTAPMVSVWLISVTDNPEAIAYYLMAVSLLSFIVALGVTETGGKALKN